jgi:hypothetical protein
MTWSAAMPMVCTTAPSATNSTTRWFTSRVSATTISPQPQRHLSLPIKSISHTSITQRSPPVVLREDCAAVYCDARDVATTHRHRKLAAGAEHDDAAVSRVSDDELVEGRACDALGMVQHAHAHVAYELAVHAEHAHAAVEAVGDGDAALPGHEAQSSRVHELAFTDAFAPEASMKRAVATLEHTDATTVGHSNELCVGAHPYRSVELTHAHKRVSVEARRQHLHAPVDGVCDEHEAVGCDAQLARSTEAQRSFAGTTNAASLRAIHQAQLVDGVRAAARVRHQQTRAIVAHRHAVAQRRHTSRRDDVALNAAQAATKEARHGAAINASQRPRHALATAHRGHAVQFVAQHRRHTHVGRTSGRKGKAKACNTSCRFFRKTLSQRKLRKTVCVAGMCGAGRAADVARCRDCCCRLVVTTRADADAVRGLVQADSRRYCWPMTAQARPM